MAKTNKKNKQKKGSAKRKAGMRKFASLDPSGMAYARLLVDPCNAPLVHPVYPGGDVGYIIRAEAFSTYATAVNDTSGIVHWTPGYVNSTNSEVVVAGTVSGGTNVTLAANAGAPGKTFLTNTAKGARCVAACLKITYPGSESARSGRIHYGLTTAGMLDIGTVTSPDAVAQTLQHFSRTPTDTIEVVWKPNIADTEFNDPAEAAGALIRDRKSAITVAWAGLPAGVGLTMHYTAVYEWTPAVNNGLAHDALGKSTSANTMDQVLDAIIKSGFTFVRSAGHAAGAVLGSALTSGISNTFGIMPATSRMRNIAYR